MNDWSWVEFILAFNGVDFDAQDALIETVDGERGAIWAAPSPARFRRLAKSGRPSLA